MNEVNDYLRNVLLNREGLLITAGAYAAAVVESFPMSNVSAGTTTDPLPYSETCTKALEVLLQENQVDGVSLTSDFLSQELPDATIAYHRIFGFITSLCRYRFSTKEFEQNLLRAEANPAICCHFLHISSGGGEAWYLDRVSETIQNLKKPVITLFERIGGSAAYYIGCQAKAVYALTENDTIGCIGSMVDFYDWDGYFEKLGVKRIQARAHQSKLKNKTVDDLVEGRPDKYITDFLDPLNVQFVATVRANRVALAETSDDDPVLQGEIFLTPKAVEVGLIDGKRTFSEVLLEAKTLAENYRDKNKALNIFNL